MVQSNFELNDMWYQTNFPNRKTKREEPPMGACFIYLNIRELVENIRPGIGRGAAMPPVRSE